jgi:hypothetical protein
MNEEIKDKWVSRLDSGEYEQITGMLHDRGNGYCALGVLGQIYIEETGRAHWEIDLGDPSLMLLVAGSQRLDGSLPWPVRSWAGLTSIVHEIPAMNDGLRDFTGDLVRYPQSFHEIAIWIKENL